MTDDALTSGYIPAAMKREFVREDPRKAARARTDFRTVLAMALWGFSVVLGLLGNWLRWEWFTVSAPEPYPDQVWGDLLGGNWENALVIISLVLVLATGATWWLTGWARPQASKPSWLYSLATAFKWAAVTVSGAALIGIIVLGVASLSDWWMAFPGWTAQWFVQACIFAGALILPSARNPYRATERERRPQAWFLGAACVVAAFVAPWGVIAVVNGTQMTSSFSVLDEGPSSTAPGDKAAGGIDVFSTDGNFTQAGAETSAGEGGGAEPSSLSWRRGWRGAKDPKLVESIGGGTAAIRMFQATPKRDAFVLFDVATGETRVALSETEIAARSLALVENPDYVRLAFTYKNTLLRAGFADEWVSDEGIRLDGPPQGRVQETTSFKVPTDGVHATDLVEGTSWLIADAGHCDRRAVLSDGRPVANRSGNLTMIQVCNESAIASPSWAFPDELVPYSLPRSVTLFGVDAQSGDVLWIDPLPGWDEYLTAHPTDFPAAQWPEIPFEVDSQACAGVESHEGCAADGSALYSVTIGSHTSVLDPATGFR